MLSYNIVTLLPSKVEYRTRAFPIRCCFNPEVAFKTLLSPKGNKTHGLPNPLFQSLLRYLGLLNDNSVIEIPIFGRDMRKHRDTPRSLDRSYIHPAVFS